MNEMGALRRPPEASGTRGAHGTSTDPGAPGRKQVTE